MSTSDQERLWNDTKKALEGKWLNKIREIDAEDLTSPPGWSFGVGQGAMQYMDGEYVHEKLRGVHDFRPINTYTEPQEKINFLGNRGVIAMASAFLSGSCDEKLVQEKADITHDIATKHTLKAAKATPQAGFVSQDPKQKAALKHQQATEEKIAKEIQEIFNRQYKEDSPPDIHFAKLDFRSYYWQLACDMQEHNNFAIFSTEEQMWKYFNSSVMLFGNLGAVHAACKTSE